MGGDGWVEMGGWRWMGEDELPANEIQYPINTQCGIYWVRTQYYVVFIGKRNTQLEIQK